ncbi:MAG TPA: hypothetical protein ENH23_07280, partial [candidate division Zixibacteria bacterium]|nr:hypothetical protein [candidate division Zixibacteria bacterium]
MIKKTQFLMIGIVILSLIASSTTFSRAFVETHNKKYLNNLSAGLPAYGIVAHRIGTISLSLNNNGSFGKGFQEGNGRDYFTGQSVPSCEYPISSNIDYLFAGAFWIGAVVGRDTLVSTAADGWSLDYQEFVPDEYPFGAIQKRSTLFPEIDSLFDGAVSEEDYLMVYRDTGTVGIANDIISGRPHTPLNIEVTQRTFAWSYDYADDFVLFDYEIRNIGIKRLEKVYMGIYVDGDVGSTSGDVPNVYLDDISGFIETFPSKFRNCDYIDTVNIAWLADNDGDPVGSDFGENSCRAVTGTRIIRTPAKELEVSYNWWISGDNDFGPRERDFVGKLKEKLRDLGTGFLGTPEGDANKYYFMRNREFDYDQHRIGTIGSNDPLWLEPDPQLAAAWARGLDTRYLLSFGPFTIDPGERLPVSFAYVAGDNFHQDPHNLDNLPDNPDIFYKNLNFKELATNASWAARVYDNPGVDTDDDGNFGKFRVCCNDSTITYDTLSTDPLEIDTTVIFVEGDCDTLFYEGDGIPDFKGASPPPAPSFTLTPDVGSIHVRFNGLRSETTRDVFSRIIDFEGYRVYYSRDERESSFSMYASYDLENYNKFIWDESKFPDPGYILIDKPFTLDTLICLYGDSCNSGSFSPDFYPRSNPFEFGDSTFYFEPQDFNASTFGVNTPIRKIYPDQPYPSSLIPDSAQVDELTEDGFLKYFEYETTIENLLPTVPYYVNVTAFDFGSRSPESQLSALETSKSLNAKAAYANSRADKNVSANKKVYTYPNPYRYDGNYKEDGYERKPTEQLSSARDRIRAIHFANLPPKCTIKIFSLDGDLVREIIHDSDPLSPT